MVLFTEKTDKNSRNDHKLRILVNLQEGLLNLTKGTNGAA